jgi:hypothetical protein
VETSATEPPFITTTRLGAWVNVYSWPQFVIVTG